MALLDDLDRRILALLRVDARTPAASIARQLGVTRATVTKRIDRMLATGVVLGFTTRVREDVADDIRAITMIEINGRSADQVIRRLRGLPEIVALHTTNGAWDLVAEIRVASLAEFNEVLSSIRSTEGVENSESSLLLSSALG
ncbi:DNA-binding Lrp family transcriptional regulator [Kineococcus xinjiangensis]|uniref:DNA-binding Lrp family transcriptional regulator n=1 Tax=Kineococcus xinjiangensis TaxID=512762 RepID=A0A2S6IK25_9ACTN|nr:Lrp/AsnC family transcriptional regulator [Kineococcus xinjiangensis]PPK94559.1 DNA-binding Lrp family transcriptional regulator [Kineococcus xinjiangensis]